MTHLKRHSHAHQPAAALSGEVPLGRMRSIGGQWIYNKEYRSLEQDMATLMSVTPDSLRQLMTDFPFDPMTPGEKPAVQD